MTQTMKSDLRQAIIRDYRRVCEDAERRAVRGEITDQECSRRKLAARQRADKQATGIAGL